MARLRFTILGCGSSGGVPRIGNIWGACDPTNPKNRRTRCSLLIERFEGEGATRVLIDTSPDMREQLIREAVPGLDAVFYTHSHADHVNGIDDLRQIVFENEEVIADGEHVFGVMRAMDLVDRTFVAVGSGTITDITRFVSHRTRGQFISVPTAPSVDEVMRRLSSRGPSMRWVGASDEMIQLSTTDPMVEPMKPPMAAPEKPRIAPPKAPPMAEPTAPRTSVAICKSRDCRGQRAGNRKAKAMRRRHVGVSGSSITPSRS